VFNHSLLIPRKELEESFSLAIRLLSDPQIEVRELASVCLTSLLRTALPENLTSFVEQFSKLAKTPIQKRNQKSSISNEQNQINIIIRHSGVLGLSSLILSSPYDVPEWLPNTLTTLAEHLTDPSPISETAKKTFAEFWRTHTDMWHVFRERFSQDQLDIVSHSSGSPSYFA